jgi:hypothetical protein
LRYRHPVKIFFNIFLFFSRSPIHTLNPAKMFVIAPVRAIAPLQQQHPVISAESSL